MDTQRTIKRYVLAHAYVHTVNLLDAQYHESSKVDRRLVGMYCTRTRRSILGSRAYWYWLCCNKTRIELHVQVLLESRAVWKTESCQEPLWGRHNRPEWSSIFDPTATDRRHLSKGSELEAPCCQQGASKSIFTILRDVSWWLASTI